ncbi:MULTISPECIES: hypothetical protein [unclassified Brevibacterium]|uniref:hypothetical protein n=1 Tax=unclassified Brevibacterium TaxID=2614124 RepID=UPI0010F94D35|nr:MULTISPECIES: hypothetical protein [unclassified Brevibacterium]MCM1013864.1 hypothetical protein [Brevibacterium sp. XM4083]
MNDSPVESERIPFGLLCPEIIESVPPRFFPTAVWGYFETENADGETGWIERTSDGASYATILSQISGFLVETEAANAWVDDEVPVDDDDADDPDVPIAPVSSGDVLVAEASAALSNLMVYPFPDGHEATGRYVALICDDDPFESGNVELLTEDVSSDLVEGLLRVARARFAETFSFSPFDDDDEESEDNEGSADSPVTSLPDVTTFGELFAGWVFLPLPEDADVSAVWSLLLATDSDGGIQRYTRRTPLLDENVLAGALARMTFEVEARLLDSFDDDDDPTRLMRETLPELSSLVPDDSPTRPLDPRVATLATRALPAGETPIAASLLLFGTDRLGSSTVLCDWVTTPDAVAIGDEEFDGFEELGLLRSALRDLLQNGLGEF